MKRSHSRSVPGFLEGVLVALVVSTAMTLGMYTFSWLLPLGVLGHLLVFGTGLAYLLYLLARTREKTGRVTVLVLYLAVSAGLLIANLSIIWSALAAMTVIWLVRSLYYYSSVLSAGIDFALTALSVVAAVAAYLHSSSLFLSIWSLMLTQACFVWIPRNWQQRSSSKVAVTRSERFDVAFKAAEGAVRKLATQPSN